jgi:hypothetical protein
LSATFEIIDPFGKYPFPVVVGTNPFPVVVEIEVHHQDLREQQELFSSFSDPNNLSQYSVDNLQNTSLGSYNDLAQQFVQNSSVNRNFMQNNSVPTNAGGNFVSVSSQHPYIPANSTNNYNRLENLTNNSLFYPFLKLVQINFLFSANVCILYMYYQFIK